VRCSGKVASPQPFWDIRERLFPRLNLLFPFEKFFYFLVFILIVGIGMFRFLIEGDLFL
jgi:hypothetical protein